MNKHLAPLLLLAIVAPLVACSNTPGGERSEPVLEGHFGDFGEFSGLPELRDGYVFENQTTVDVRTYGPGWAVMVGLTLNGHLGQGDLVAGGRIHATGLADGWLDDGVQPAATMIGCAGPIDDNWTVDCNPDDIVVMFDEGTQDDTLLLSFTATFPEDCTLGDPPTDRPPSDDDASDPPTDRPPSDDDATDPSAPGTQVITGVIEIHLDDIATGTDFGYPDAPSPTDGEPRGPA